MNFSHISVEDEHYPNLLKEIQNPPGEIYFRGALPELKLPMVSIVGTRKATREGKELAGQIAKELVGAGVTVVSGLAMGIDTAAHRGALDGGGSTIAVLGNGIDSVYPAQNYKLAERIIKMGGTIISEYAPGEPSFKHRFIERNRIISGLSLGVVVVEAPGRSGALSTARFAGEQGRGVFVFPSSPKNKNYEGSHSLIRDGATLITKTDDILEDLDIDRQASSPLMTRELNAEEYRVVSAISAAGKPINVDMIIELTTLEPHAVSRVVTMLTVEGIIIETETGYEISNR